MDTAEGEILVVAAERLELEGILAHCARVERLRLPLGFAARARLNGRSLLLAANGPGPALAARAVKAMPRAAALVSAGFCGALDPALRSGDIFVATGIVCGAGSRPAAPALVPAHGEAHRGLLLSLDRVVLTPEEKRSLRAATGAGAVEMESAGLAALAAEMALPLYAVRVVMDEAGQGFLLDFNACRLPGGRFSRPRILGAALRRPWTAIPELIRVRRASRDAARALGDFFVHCRF